MQKDDLFAAVDDMAPSLREWARDVWELAEPAQREHDTAAYLASILEREGFDVTTGVDGLPTAIVASYGDGEPHVGVLGEYDALPGLSQRVVAHRDPHEEGAPGHGCGHNLHGVGALGGALAVKEAIDRRGFSGTITFYGCPAEETLVGKPYMARAGAFDGLDAALAWHPADVSTVRLATANALDSIAYTFSGEAAHAASQPESGRSALDAVQLMNTGVEYLREHIPDDARVHYIVTDGGEAPNVVPSTAGVKYFARSPSRSAVERIATRLDDIAEGAASMTGTSVERRQLTGCHGYAPNETVGMQVWANMEQVGSIEYSDDDRAFAAELRETIPEEDRDSRLSRYPPTVRDRIGDAALYGQPEEPFDRSDHSPGTADLGEVCRIAPTVQFRGAAWPVGTPPHTWQAVAASGGIGLAALPFAAKVFAGTVWDLFREPDVLADARTEHEAMTNEEFEPAVPAGVDPPAPT